MLLLTHFVQCSRISSVKIQAPSSNNGALRGPTSPTLQRRCQNPNPRPPGTFTCQTSKCRARQASGIVRLEAPKHRPDTAAPSLPYANAAAPVTPRCLSLSDSSVPALGSVGSVLGPGLLTMAWPLDLLLLRCRLSFCCWLTCV
jgi:hypothetical protein